MNNYKRTERVGFVTNKLERDALRLLADEEGVSEAVILRKLIRKEAVRRNIWQDILMGYKKAA
ncbi:MAG: hypothetical protein GY797_34210 [Deltaproteobacteria bacterium]|nr:hypothetical protein [Deltaproteobacteria bacterium]